MQRRLLLAAAAGWPAVRLRAQQQDAEPRPRQKISAAALFEALSARFPLRLGVPGLLQLDVSAPRLLLLPARNQLGASLVAQASSPSFQALPPGELDLVFGLRYEAADRTVRAVRPEVLDLRLPGVVPDMLQAVRALLPALTRDIAGAFVLHRFTDRELALPDTMGFAPEQLTVLDDGLLVVFGPKR